MPKGEEYKYFNFPVKDAGSRSTSSPVQYDDGGTVKKYKAGKPVKNTGNYETDPETGDKTLKGKIQSRIDKLAKRRNKAPKGSAKWVRLQNKINKLSGSSKRYKFEGLKSAKTGEYKSATVDERKSKKAKDKKKIFSWEHGFVDKKDLPGVGDKKKKEEKKVVKKKEEKKVVKKKEEKKEEKKVVKKEAKTPVTEVKKEVEPPGDTPVPEEDLTVGDTPVPDEDIKSTKPKKEETLTDSIEKPKLSSLQKLQKIALEKAKELKEKSEAK